MSTRIWVNTAQAADHAGCHPDTVRRSLEDGSLHGTQRKANGRWRIHINCLNAWCAGAQCDHQKAGAA
jgi:hypothetical protein